MTNKNLFKNVFMKASVSIIAVVISMASFTSYNKIGISAISSIDEGIYTIYSSLSDDKVLDITERSTSNGTNIELYTVNNSVAQIFRLNYEGNDYYNIQMASTSNMVLDVSGGEGYSGCNVILHEYNGGDNQLWKFVSTGNDDEYYIVSKTGYYLDVAGAKKSDKTNIQVYSQNKSNAQKFKIKLHYDETKAIDYAEKYTDDSGKYSGTYNKTYNIYKNPNPKSYLGFDCSNFVSQVIYTAGLVPTNEWEPVYRGQGYKGNTAKTNWVSVDNLYAYLKSLGYPISKVKSDLSNIHKGDIVFTGEGKHATICTGFKNNVPVYCAHSKWRKDYLYNYEDFKDGYVVDMSFTTIEKLSKLSQTTTISSNNQQSYIIRSNSGAKVRNNAGLSNDQTGALAKGSIIYYDQTENIDGYVWYHISDASVTEGSWGEYIGKWVANI